MLTCDLDPLVVQRLQQEALAGQPVSRMLVMLQAELSTEDWVANGMTSSSYLEEAFGWSIKQCMAVSAWHGFKDIAASWTDEMIDARYAPLLQEWIQNPPPPRPSAAEEDAALSLSVGPLSDDDVEETLNSPDLQGQAMGTTCETSVGKRTSKTIKAVVFFIGCTAALALSIFAVWAGSRDNIQGEYFDTLTGQWDWWFVAHHFIWPQVLWVAVFALFGGFRQQVER